MTLANLARRLNSGRLPSAILVTDEARLPDPMPLVRRLPPGTGVVFRHYGDPHRRELARRLAVAARSRRLLLLVAADWRLAAWVGAAGVHLPEPMARAGRLAPLLGWARRHGRLVTVAAHSRAALAAARRIGVDGALLSPVFPTRSHPGGGAIGAVRFRLWARRAGLPVVALGGVTRRRLPLLAGAGGIAALDGWA